MDDQDIGSDQTFEERAGRMFDAPFEERAGNMFDPGAADPQAQADNTPSWMEDATAIAPGAVTPGAAAALGGDSDSLTSSLMGRLNTLQEKADTLQEERKAALDPLYKEAHQMIQQPGPAVPQLEKSPKAPTQEIGQGAMQFLQVATVFGALAGLLARRGTTTSLNAFGAAIKGFTEGNMEVYKSKYEEWKAATTEVQNNNQQKLDQYNAIWRDRKMNIDQKMEEMKIVASQYGDEITYNLATQRNYTALAQAVEKQMEFQQRFGQATDRQKLQNEKWIAHLDEQKLKHDNAKEIGDAIIRGEQPPTTTALYGSGPEVRAYLAKNGFNQAKAQLEWQEIQKQILAFNTPQMAKFQGLAVSVVKTIDEVKARAAELKQGGVPTINSMKLTAAEQLRGNTPQGQLVAKYLASVNTLIEEYANLANGGYAPTEPAWKLAHQQISATFGQKQLGAAIDETQRLINLRMASFQEVREKGFTGAPNRYREKPAAAEKPIPEKLGGKADPAEIEAAKKRLGL